MSDVEFQKLMRYYYATASDEALYKANVYAVRYGLVDLPTTLEEVWALEEIGRPSLPILRAALAAPVQPPEGDPLYEDNAHYYVIAAIGRLGSIDDIPLLEGLADYLDSIYTGYYTHITSRKARDVVSWLRIRHDYGFTDETTIWDVINASPLIDEIIVAANANAVTNLYYQNGYGRWRQDKTAYPGMLHEHHSYKSEWRISLPGYGSGGDLSSALSSTLSAILAAKYRGRIQNYRDPLPREEWPEEIVFITTERAVDILSNQQLHWTVIGEDDRAITMKTDPYRFNYLFLQTYDQ